MLTKYYDSVFGTDLLNSFKLLDDLYGRPTKTKTYNSAYRTELTDNELILSVDLPGVKSKDLSVQTTGREVKVSGKLRGEEFKYMYQISKEYDPDSIDATLEDGVLTLKFRKLKANETRTVEVNIK